MNRVIRELASTRSELIVLHVLSPDELDPPLEGDLRLVDTETGESIDVTALTDAFGDATVFTSVKGIHVWNKDDTDTLTVGGVENGQPEDFLDRAASRIPLGRMARPDEYQGAILYLLSDASSFMTGQVVRPNGGVVMP